MISIRIPSRKPLIQDNSPTKQRLLHANDNFKTDPTTGAIHMQDTPIQRLLRSGRITATQAEAASRLYADYYAAGLAPLGAMDYERPIVDGTPPKNESDRRLAAVDRYNHACRACGPHLRVVDNAVLREAYPERLDRLALGLNLLARHYGLETK